MYQFTKRKVTKIIFICFTLANFIISCVTHYVTEPFWLNENQLLYIFATIAQVSGSLLGLTLAAYALIDDKLKKIGVDEEESFDYVNRMRKDSFYNLILISMLSISAIILSLLVLSLYRNQYLELAIFFMLEAIYLFLHLLIEIYIFIKNTNPNTIVVRKKEEKRQFDSEYDTTSNNSTKSLGSFISYYNMLENTIKSFAQTLLDDKNSNMQLQFLDSLDILKDQSVISQKCYAQINELRLYRNSLVHSTENTEIVNPALFEILQKIYDLLFSITTALRNSKMYTKSINDLNTYINSLPSKIDVEILEFIIAHPRADIRDIAGSLNISISSASRKMQKLIMYGYVTKQSLNRRTIFQLALPTESNGVFSFDYSNNNGIYIIGVNEWKFSTKWSKGSNDIIHVYSDCEDIDCIARIKQGDISNISISDLTNCDYSSRCRDIAIGDIAVWKNKNGHYLLTLITAIQDDSRGYDNDLVHGTYKILI